MLKVFIPSSSLPTKSGYLKPLSLIFVEILKNATDAFAAGDFQQAFELWTTALSHGELYSAFLSFWFFFFLLVSISILPFSPSLFPMSQSMNLHMLQFTPTVERLWCAWVDMRKLWRFTIKFSKWILIVLKPGRIPVWVSIYRQRDCFSMCLYDVCLHV